MKRLLAALALNAAMVSFAQAQVTYIGADRTIAGGNAINAPVNGAVYVGRDSTGANVVGVDADFVPGASVTGGLVGYSDSVTNIYAGNYNGITATDSSRITVATAANSGEYSVQGGGTLTVGGGTAAGVTVSQNGSARITGGTYVNRSSFTLLEASGGTSLLELAGGTAGGAVRASTGGVTRVSGGSYDTLHALPGGLIEVSGGLPTGGARLAALNRGAGNANRGRFAFYGSDLTLSNATAGSYYDPTYLISSPGVFFTLTGTLADGRSISASYFEEGIRVGDAPTQLQFVTVVPEPSVLVLFLLPLVGIVARRVGTTRRRGNG